MAILFLLIEFFDELHYGVQSAVLPVLRQDLGLSYNQIGLLLGLPGVIGTLIEPILMLLGDTALRKRLVLGGGLVIAVALLLIAASSSFAAVLFAFVISFPASGAFVSLAQATLMDLNPGRESHMMARWTVAGSVGNLVGPLLVAGAFALALGWRLNYLALAIFCLALVALVWPRSFPRRRTVQTLQKTSEPASESTSGAEGEAAAPVNLRTDLAALPVNLWRALRQPALLRWFLLLQMSDLLLDVFSGFVALYFADVVGLSPAQVGLLLAVLMLTGLLADLALIPLLERFPGRALVRASAALAVFIYLAWLLVPWPPAKVALVVAIRFATLGWYQVLQGEAYAALPGRSGTVMALNSAAGLLGGAMAYAVGLIADRAGLPLAMWALILGPLSLALFVPRPQDAREG